MNAFQQESMERVILLTKASRERKKLLEEFVYILNEKANIEEAHNENLLRFNKTLTTFLEKTEGVIEVSLSSFHSFQTIEYQQTQELIQSIRMEIIPEIQKMILNQNLSESKISIETRSENKKLLEQFEKVQKMKDKIWEKRHDKLAEKATSELEKSLKDSVESFKKSMDDYIKNLENSNQYFYQQDDKRLELLKDSLMKYFIYEISRIRNLQYDSQKIATKLESISLENENIFLKHPEIIKMNDSTKHSFQKFSAFIQNSLTNPPESSDFPRRKREFNERVNETWMNLMQKWDDYKSKNVGFFSQNKNPQRDKSAAFSFFEQYFQTALKGDKNSDENTHFLRILLKDSQTLDTFCHFIDTYRNVIKNPLNETQFEGLSLILTQIMSQLIEQNQIDTLKKTIQFSKYFFKIKKSHENSNLNLRSRHQEEKYFVFSDLRGKLSYTQANYWEEETRSRLNIVLEKFNNFVNENLEDRNNELFIESFKSLILNQLRHVNKEMSFVNFQKAAINELFHLVNRNFIAKENSELFQIIQEIITENFEGNPGDNKENQAIMSSKKKIFEENKALNPPLNLLTGDGFELLGKKEEKAKLDLLDL